jgi:hypothetical protein
MQSVREAPRENQAANSPESQEKVHSTRRDGIEIVSSALLSSRFFHERLTILRGQLTIIRRRAESGIPVSVESIARAEHLARTLELFEAAA